jgi:micrococcal nuclease|tara:strand:- start:181 stop:654 length:474 start_codon:yes stop_codon:yes gene_type:complete
MYEYRAKINRVVDGDTVDCDIELGFGVVLADERVRVMGIDTPESRTSDRVEKLFGKAAKYKLQELLGETCILKTQIAKNGEDMKGKFGRILGDFIAEDGRLITDIMAETGHCVPYFGGSKEDTQAAHEVNRVRLLAEGVVDQVEYDKMVIAEANEKK